MWNREYRTQIIRSSLLNSPAGTIFKLRISFLIGFAIRPSRTIVYPSQIHRTLFFALNSFYFLIPLRRYRCRCCYIAVAGWRPFFSSYFPIFTTIWYDFLAASMYGTLFLFTASALTHESESYFRCAQNMTCFRILSVHCCIKYIENTGWSFCPSGFGDCHQ